MVKEKTRVYTETRKLTTPKSQTTSQPSKMPLFLGSGLILAGLGAYLLSGETQSPGPEEVIFNMSMDILEIETRPVSARECGVFFTSKKNGKQEWWFLYNEDGTVTSVRSDKTYESMEELAGTLYLSNWGDASKVLAQIIWETRPTNLINKRFKFVWPQSL